MDRVAASKQVGKLPQPEGMQHPTWLRMKKILRSLCKHLPDPYPGIKRISAQTRIPVPTVARLLSRAEALGLVARVNRPLPGRFDSYAYRLIFLDETVSISTQIENEEEQLRCSSLPPVRTRISAGGCLPPAGRQKALIRRNLYDGNCAICNHLVYAGTGHLESSLPVHDCCDTGETDRNKLREYFMVMKERFGDPDAWGDAFGEDPEAPLPVYSPPPQKPQARLARHFEDRWNDALNKHADWRGNFRGIDLGPAIGYINTKFLAAGYSEEHVRAMFNEFFDDLLWPGSALSIKEGQSAWQLFTGWWGHNAVPDPKIERERQALHERIIRQAHKQFAEREATVAAAWERIDAAEIMGVDPDPEDVVATIGGDPRLWAGRRRLRTS